MATTTIAEKPRSLGKLMAAGLIGSSIEWYDFFIYGTAAALVFGKLFFPYASPLVGTLLAFSTFWAGFIARPIGGLIFGHIGDRIGRKPALVACLAITGCATFLIGLFPPPPPSAPSRLFCWCHCVSCRASRSADNGVASPCC